MHLVNTESLRPTNDVVPGTMLSCLVSMGSDTKLPVESFTPLREPNLHRPHASQGTAAFGALCHRCRHWHRDRLRWCFCSRPRCISLHCTGLKERTTAALLAQTPNWTTLPFSVVWMVALQAPFGVQVLILRPAPGAHISTGPPPFEGGVGGTEKLKASSVEPECLGSYAVCGCSCAHAVLHNNRRTLSSDAKLDDASFFRRVDGSAASAVRRAGSDPTAGAGCAYQHRPAHTAPPSAGSPDHSEEHARRSAAAPSTA